MSLAVLTVADVDKIVQLYDCNFSDGWSKNMLESAFRGGRFLALGTFENQKLIGVITLSIAIDDADIEGVTVDSLYRRKGIGEKLVRGAIAHVLSMGIKKILLEVRESNAQAIALYEKVGFKNISVRKNYYQDGENALVFLKEN